MRRHAGCTSVGQDEVCAWAGQDVHGWDVACAWVLGGVLRDGLRDGWIGGVMSCHGTTQQ
jgi:hypothetical protein